VIEVALAHQVTEATGREIGPKSAYAVSPQQLGAYLERRKEWEPVCLRKQGLRSDSKRRNLLVTFDDGFRDNLTEALPVLEKYACRAIVFVATGFIDGSTYPYELELAEALSKHATLQLPDRAAPVSIETSEARAQCYKQIRMPLKWARHDEREAFMEKLAARNDYTRSTMQTERFLSWDEVRELDEHPLVEIGAHSRRHVVLTKQPLRTAYREILKSKERLETILGHDVPFFSYPYGASNFFVRRMAQWAGVRYAFTTETARVQSLSVLNRMAIPRIDLSDPSALS